MLELQLGADGRALKPALIDDLLTGLLQDLSIEKLRDTLNGCIGCGCLSLDACTLYNADDRAAQRGTGPRYLMGDSPD